MECSYGLNHCSVRKKRLSWDRCESREKVYAGYDGMGYVRQRLRVTSAQSQPCEKGKLKPPLFGR